MVKEFVRLSELGIFQFESPATKTSPVPTMNLRGFFTAAAAAIIAVSIATAQAETIDHDQVVPFAQPKASTISQKAAVKFKPQIHITNGCHPYPAVNEAGQTGGGLKPTGAPSSSCKGSGWGSQVYGRSTWYSGRWAIMYSWYFRRTRRRPDWVIVTTGSTWSCGSTTPTSPAQRSWLRLHPPTAATLTTFLLAPTRSTATASR
ncbi:hypothetical protein PF010_g23155 [Phytophthora fragariae]|uniref:Uncharacterized protein n=1 Tax=Phytophthora fragariae TaxID=53985 RepID=A0A6A3EAF1_9STRA|nr:hypothetical protein PF003_g7133 [Phytophthora fragariae]KAE8930525.1 hypothetical protein PF009_g19387 [Phytophthora fragariae]KAE9078361.1 hypothetical protein PF010_g23155 [Phytophthora fragariae]KAE9078482.1 hypothetical protein PF007_g23841 [Phytophthora fragariae]